MYKRQVIVSDGVSAHGSTPELGVNGIIILLDAVKDLKIGGDYQKVFDFLRTKIGRETNGESLGICYQDEETGEDVYKRQRWNGLNKSGGMIDALDDAEYSGSIISLIENGEAFIKRNSRMMWRKTDNSREEMPEYVERSYHEALINGLAHRDYLINGSEVHIDIYDCLLYTSRCV